MAKILKAGPQKSPDWHSFCCKKLELRGLLVDADFTAAPAAARPGSGAGPIAPVAAGLGGTLLLAVLGGLILNLMPCVFPVLGIKILGFVNQAGHQRRGCRGHTVLTGQLAARARPAHPGGQFQLSSATTGPVDRVVGV
jgi:thiol:disulfide interchange protein